MVSNHATQTFDGRVQPVLEVYERPLGPQMTSEFLAAQDFGRALEEQGQHVEGLVLQSQAHAVLA
jgi:hypothetical protein